MQQKLKFPVIFFRLTHRSTENNHDRNKSEIAVAAAAEFIKLELDDCKLPSMMQWKYIFINVYNIMHLYNC